MLANAGFDTGTQGWTATLANADADGCAGSHAVTGSIDFCQTVRPGTRYFTGWQMRGAGTCLEWTYGDPGCQMPYIPVGSDMPIVVARFDSAGDFWQPYATMFTPSAMPLVNPDHFVNAPTGVNSIRIFCTLAAGTFMDQAYMSATAAGF
jgi:hypothetical protein